MKLRAEIFGVVLAAGLLGAVTLFGWDSKIHTGIIHAALMAIPREDRVQERWGDEVWRLREYVQMGDWINTLVAVREDWDTGGQTLEQKGIEFFANDYLLFPRAPKPFQHAPPQVLETYRPFFLRALQALRTESAANSARWTGSLLHFVTDSGSPPHASGVSGPDHVKMESWLDPSVIDLTQYHPQMLGNDDESATKGLIARMDGLIAFSKIRGKAMMPFVKVEDRAHMEPLALESAAESARVAADVIHTLLRLSEDAKPANGASLVARVTAPAVEGLPNLPAKLVILGTDFSTLSEASLPGFHEYRGVFSLHNLAAGTYRLGVERIGSRTLLVGPLTLKAGETAQVSWTLQPSLEEHNLVPNPELSLRWVTPDAPDHWLFDAPRHQWVSDQVPVTAGRSYGAGCKVRNNASPGIELQWMAHAWEALKGPTIPFELSGAQSSRMTVTAPSGALFARFVVKSQSDPSTVLNSVFLKAIQPR